MIISNDKKISDIQREFTSKFPNLKIEFYILEHVEGEGSKQSSKININQTIGTIRSTNKDGDLSVDEHQKVSTLEERFKEDFGLNVQVFRKSGDLWLQTTSTDNWTLSEQNQRSQR